MGPSSGTPARDADALSGPSTVNIPSRRVKDLFVLPESVLKASFVEKLSEAVNEPEPVPESYVVTPGLAQAFDRGLTFMGRGLAEKRSIAAFVHGSFGSGKSHFMAMLHFLVTGNEHAWRIPELHGLRDKHPFCGKAKVLPLTFHMVGHASLSPWAFSWTRTSALELNTTRSEPARLSRYPMYSAVSPDRRSASSGLMWFGRGYMALRGSPS